MIKPRSDSRFCSLTPDELLFLQEFKDTAMRSFGIEDMPPDDALQQTAEKLLIKVQSRALKLK
ncbi:hypothetical protein [Microcoleus sp. MON2_D5]|uniref:hypothetical protein n=1 Tax=Microcoleus sp. MON2_D5 TaxID=2818833 RepID=UPI002FCF826E